MTKSENTGNILLIGLRQAEFPEDFLDRVKELAPNMEILLSRDSEVINKVKGRVEIAFYRSPYDSIFELDNLKWLQQWAAGLDWLAKHPAMAKRPFALTNSSGTHANPIAEHVFGYLLTFSRRLHHAVEARINRNWFNPEHGTLYELEGKTILVVGVGAIGSRTAEIASGFGMNVIGIRKHPENTIPSVNSMYGPEILHGLLPSADYVILTLPLTAETQDLFGAKEFRLMRKTAFLVNVGRGGSVVDPDLIQALQNGDIAGAALDVHANSPISDDSPLWEMNNVILTSHYSSVSDLKDGRVFSLFLENLGRYRDGSTLLNRIEKEKGY
jgi:phosphoglycerate dehydrogenase-like enzyme